MRIVFASGNIKKYQEASAFFVGSSVELVSQATLQIPEVAETGLTFIENAIIKARNACHYSAGLPVLADDSGLEVDALGGAPGVFSARYAGVDATDALNIAKLLHDLQAVPAEERTARFHCVLVYMQTAIDPAPIVCEGIWEGIIIPEPSGVQGFGYDPIFFVPTHNCSAAQLQMAQKNQISHRAQAFKSMLKTLGVSI